jgi:tetratricopeptide (TPR) repeat protein
MLSLMPAPRTRIVRHKAKGPIDPTFGVRVRTLRQVQGLTQEALAGTDFTKGFISLLEGGRTRASLRAAEIIAKRLGVPVTDLLAPADDSRRVELTLLQAEGELTAGRADAALTRLRALAERTPKGLRPRALRLEGRALIALGQAKDAVAPLEEAVRGFRELGAHDAKIRALFDLATAHARLDHPGEALALSLQCEAALQSGDIVDRTLELRVRSLLAIAFMRLGDAGSADLQAERAAKLASDVVDPWALANLFSTLTLARQEQGDLDAALYYATKALDAMRVLEDDASFIAALNNLGWIYGERGQHARALETLDRAETMAHERNLNPLRGMILASKAEVRLHAGEENAAIELADAAASTAGASQHARGLALLIRAEALARGEGSPAVVRDAFAKAIEMLRNEPPRIRARAHRSLSRYLARRGRTVDALAELERAVTLLQEPPPPQRT